MNKKSFIVTVAIWSILTYWSAFVCGGGIFMKEIKLTKGKVALVDEADFERLNKFKWYARRGHNTYYATRDEWLSGQNKGKKIHMHRDVLGLTDPKIQCDHINGNGLDNQNHNLREATNQQNSRNQGLSKNNKSGVVGVFWNERSKKWLAKIKVDYKNINLGYFKTKEDAISAREAANIRYFGEFTRKKEAIEG